MKRQLDILVPHYNESQEIVSQLLDSIKIQQNVDFDEIGVIICDDGPNSVELSRDFLNSYPFVIEYYREEKGGVSRIRNLCMDHSKANYVMWCDCDDMFLNVCGLYIIFREIENGGFEFLVSNFTEESRDPETREIIYINHEQMDLTFVHGKVYNRKFLVTNKIRWNDNLTIHEDSYFNLLVYSIADTDNSKYYPMPFYLWKWRDESVCRHDNKYILKTFNNMIESNTALLRELFLRKIEDFAKEYSTMMVLDAYYTLNKKEWIEQENQEYRISTEKRFKEYWDEFKNLYETIDEMKKNEIIMGRKNMFMQEGVFLEQITFNDWIKHIEDTY